MDSVFIAGSRAVSKLTADVKERLENIAKKQFVVLIGDANGADKAVQTYLHDMGYPRVIVYCMDECRNNKGGWPIRFNAGDSKSRRDRFYYGIKDRAMAKDATWGFMLWNGESKGTIANVLNLLALEKKVLLFLTSKKRFYTLRSQEDCDHLLLESGVEDVAGFLASLEIKRDKHASLTLSGFHS